VDRLSIKESRPRSALLAFSTSRFPPWRKRCVNIIRHSRSRDHHCDASRSPRRRVTFPVVAKFVDEIVTVDEDESPPPSSALEREKTLAEGAPTALASLRAKENFTTAEPRTAFWFARQYRRHTALGHHRARPVTGWPTDTPNAFIFWTARRPHRSHPVSQPSSQHRVDTRNNAPTTASISAHPSTSHGDRGREQ